MKLTKPARAELRRVLAHAERAADYLAREDVAIALRRDQATTTLDYQRPDGAVLTEVNKEYGSDLAGLSFAIEKLNRFLATH